MEKFISMKILFRLMILFLLISCNKKAEQELPEYETQEELNNRITEGKPFFDFDEVVHYQIDISEEDYYKLKKEDTVSRQTELLQVFLEWENPSNDEDKVDFYEALNSDRVVKKVVNSKYSDELRTKIFTEKTCDEVTVTSCLPLYRDIFVLSKNKKETEIVKICFDCKQVSFSKGIFIYDCFGMNGEFKRLQEIISENKKLK
ncbi:hypothetical protein ACFPVY_14495 [Flavobacterium qiangtangense]|uniref:Lipoprotein n=1 Tax=Flavobacterium qiangtangense TaxID=1442595 RepID=A0ABW1PRJ6_9FLAO